MPSTHAQLIADLSDAMQRTQGPAQRLAASMENFAQAMRDAAANLPASVIGPFATLAQHQRKATCEGFTSQVFEALDWTRPPCWRCGALGGADSCLCGERQSFTMRAALT